MNKRASTILMLIGSLLLAGALLAGCTSGSIYNDQQSINQQLSILQQAQPVPRFDYSLERDVFIQIYQARNNAVATYTVVVSSYGTLLWECPSRGYPIAADTQLTNPLQALGDSYQGSVVEQAEPNGLYSSKNTVGTWVMCVLDDGTIYPIYTEMNANTFPFPVKLSLSGQFVRADGSAPTVSLDIKK